MPDPEPGLIKATGSGTVTQGTFRDRVRPRGGPPHGKSVRRSAPCVRPWLAPVRPPAPSPGPASSLLYGPLMTFSRSSWSTTAPPGPVARTGPAPPRTDSAVSSPQTGPTRCRRRHSGSSDRVPGPHAPRSSGSCQIVSRAADTGHATAARAAFAVASPKAPGRHASALLPAPGDSRFPAWFTPRQQRRGTRRSTRCRRCGRLAAPEAVLVEDQPLAEQMVDGPAQLGSQDGQGLALATFLLLPLLPLLGPRTGA